MIFTGFVHFWFHKYSHDQPGHFWLPRRDNFFRKLHSTSNCFTGCVACQTILLKPKVSQLGKKQSESAIHSDGSSLIILKKNGPITPAQNPHYTVVLCGYVSLVIRGFSVQQILQLTFPLRCNCTLSWANYSFLEAIGTARRVKTHWANQCFFSWPARFNFCESWILHACIFRSFEKITYSELGEKFNCWALR